MGEGCCGEFRASPTCSLRLHTPLRVLCTTTVIPAKAGIQRGRATASKAKRQAQTPSFPLEHQEGGLCTAPLRGVKEREMVWFVLLGVPASAGMTVASRG